MTYSPFIEPDRTAFGEQSVAEITPISQLQFAYDVNPNLLKIRANQSGSVDENSNMARLQTGAAANSSGEMLSRRTIKYSPGQGGVVRFTAVFANGTANNTQIVGIGDTDDGYFFCYNGTAFGLLVRKGGVSEIRTLTISAKSTTAEDITITLDDDAKTDVTVTDASSGDKTTTANDIASADYSDVGRGWDAEAVGDTVIFISWGAGSKSGDYTLDGASTAAGTFASTLVGVAVSETIVIQSNWSEDTMDGNGPSGMTINPQKGNVYQIKYQWLGFGEIEFFIEDSATGHYVLVHRIEYANANTSPSVNNPTLPLYAGIVNVSNTSNLILFIASMMGGIEGRLILTGPRHATKRLAAAGNSGIEHPMLTIRNKEVYKGTHNRTHVFLSFAGLTQDSTKPAIVQYTFNAVLTGASFSDVDSNSIVEVDTTATAMSGGSVAFADGVAKAGRSLFLLQGEDVIIGPGVSLTISIIPGANTPDTVAAFNWIDDF